MVSIVCITTAFILYESEPDRRVLADGLTEENGNTHKRLEAVRGAGISHRTSRPYLQCSRQ
jgi:hypothetical protein